jgi:hypothetical protein
MMTLLIATIIVVDLGQNSRDSAVPSHLGIALTSSSGFGPETVLCSWP